VVIDEMENPPLSEVESEEEVDGSFSESPEESEESEDEG
jgi:hypothetical protein